MPRRHVGLSRMSGSETDEGLTGSNVGIRTRNVDYRHTVATKSYQELWRRRFYDRPAHLDRPVLHRRNGAASLSRTSITPIPEAFVDVAGTEEEGADLGTDIVPPPVPAVPEFPSLSHPAPPPYPFNTLSSQSVLSSPPSSPVPSDTLLTPTASHTAPSLSQTYPSPDISASSDLSRATTPTTATPTANAPYSNTTLATSASSNLIASTGLISSYETATLATHTSNSFKQSTPTNAVIADPDGASAAASLTGTRTAPDSNATPGSSSDPSTSSSGLSSPNTPQVVGGIVGGVAGLAVILLVILFYLRRYRQQLRHRGELLGIDRPERDPTHATSMRSSQTPLVAAVAAPFKKLRPGSSQTTTTAETGTSDRAFQRVAGRKIETVLSSGGDGYGSNYGAFQKQVGIDKETGATSSSLAEAQPLAGMSFYRDNTDLDCGHGSGTSTPTDGQPRLATGYRDFADSLNEACVRGPSPDGVAFMRPSPARSPVTTSAGPSSQLGSQTPGNTMSSETPPTPSVPPRFMVDGLGRSLVSQDGSRGSRFTESV